MAQFRNFNFVAIQGNSVLSAVWEVTIGPVSMGPFDDIEAISWSGGTGLTVMEGSKFKAGLVRFIRTTGDEPFVDAVLLGGATSATATIIAIRKLSAGSREDINPPRFGDSPKQGPVTGHATLGDLLVASPLSRYSSISNKVYMISSVTRDTIVLVDTWEDGTLFDIRGVIVRDFIGTPADIPTTNSGDERATTVVGEAIRKLDDLLDPVLEDWQGFTAGGFWRNSWDDYLSETVSLRMEDGIVVMTARASKGSPTPGEDMFLLPVGYRPRYKMEFEQSGQNGISVVRILVSGIGKFVSGNSPITMDNIRIRPV